MNLLHIANGNGVDCSSILKEANLLFIVIIEDLLSHHKLNLDVVRSVENSYALKQNCANIGPPTSDANAFIQTVNGLREGKVS